MSRPNLDATISAEDFLAWYWLKAELVVACRTLGLETTGRKSDLTARLFAFLSGTPVPAAPKPGKRDARMPVILTLETQIGVGWRCSTALRHFLEAEIGPSFHFNDVVRDMIFHGHGRTLGDVVAAYRQSLTRDRGTSEIASQFQFNGFLRQFHADNPGANRQQAIQAWKARRDARGGLAPII